PQSCDAMIAAVGCGGSSRSLARPAGHRFVPLEAATECGLVRRFVGDRVVSAVSVEMHRGLLGEPAATPAPPRDLARCTGTRACARCRTQLTACQPVLNPLRASIAALGS